MGVAADRNVRALRMGLETEAKMGENPNMHTLVADDKKRVRIPDAKPGQVFAYEKDGKTITLSEVVKKKTKEPFPPGSLLKYFTGPLGKERDELETALAKGCVQGPE